MLRNYCRVEFRIELDAKHPSCGSPNFIRPKRKLFHPLFALYVERDTRIGQSNDRSERSFFRDALFVSIAPSFDEEEGEGVVDLDQNLHGVISSFLLCLILF